MDTPPTRSYTQPAMRIVAARCLLPPATLLLTVVMWTSTTRADEVDRVWQSLYADHLPEWCKYTQELPNKRFKSAFGHPNSAPYRAAFGEKAWWALHHYCRGLDMMYDASKTTDMARRRFLYTNAVEECQWVLDRTDDTFVLKPEIHYKKGIALMSLERRVEAVECFTAALAIRADYVPAYVALSLYFERAGDSAEAIRVLQEGLQHVKDSPQLKQRLADLEARRAKGQVAHGTPP